MAIFAYGRVSTKDQSTENQRLDIENAGFKIDYWFADVGISGKSHASQRPQLKILFDKIRDGETIVVTKLDRLGRDAQDINATIKTFAARNIEVIVLQLGKLDITSSAGKLMLNMLAAIAEMELDQLIERTKSGLERAKREGKVLGRPKKTSTNQRVKIINMRKNGTSVSELSRLYNISRASIMRVTGEL